MLGGFDLNNDGDYTVFVAPLFHLATIYRIFTRVHNIEEKCEKMREQIEQIKSQGIKNMNLWVQYFDTNHNELSKEINNKVDALNSDLVRLNQFNADIFENEKGKIRKNIETYKTAITDLQAVVDLKCRCEFRIEAVKKS